MLDHVAFGVNAACTGARVATLLVQTRQVAGTLGVDNTLRAAVGWNADISGQTTARGDAAFFTALCIFATWIGDARVDRGWGRNSFSGH